MVVWYIFPLLVCCDKKNLATLGRQNEKAIFSWRKKVNLKFNFVAQVHFREVNTEDST
jgi:hypothetical protein